MNIYYKLEATHTHTHTHTYAHAHTRAHIMPNRNSHFVFICVGYVPKSLLYPQFGFNVLAKLDKTPNRQSIPYLTNYIIATGEFAQVFRVISEK